MKRLMSICLLAALICCVMISPALAAGESMTDPVEIIDSTTPTESPAPTEPSPDVRGPVSGDSVLDVWGITDPNVPMAAYNGTSGAAWSVVNLLCAVLTTVFGGIATGEAVKVKKKKEELRYGDENYIVLQKEKTRTENGVKTAVTEFVRKSSLWKTGLYDLASSAASIVTFILTENIRTPMCLTDKWTPLMAVILAACLTVYGLTVGGKKLDQELMEKIREANTTTAGV